MAKIKVGDIVLYRNWRLGDGLFGAKVQKVDKKKGLVLLIPWNGEYGHGSPWTDGALPMVLTTSIASLSPAWLAMSGDSEGKLKESRYDYEDDIPTVVDEMYAQ